MTLASEFLDSVDAIYGVVGVPATFTDRDSSATAVTAIIEYDLQQYGGVAEIAGKTATISVRVSELALPPRRGETYTIGSTVYTVDSILLSDELEHRALVA